jgi:hypothetical protein
MSPSETATPVQVSDEGELTDKLFCLYCGELNHPGVDVCQSCGKYIADQGPDLHSRLKRIGRYASSVHSGQHERPPTFSEWQPTEHCAKPQKRHTASSAPNRIRGDVQRSSMLTSYKGRRSLRAGRSSEYATSSEDPSIAFVIGYGMLLIVLAAVSLIIIFFTLGVPLVDIIFP